MKRILFLSLFVFVFLKGKSQIEFQSQKPQKKRCATYEVIEGLRRLHPGASTDAQFEEWLAQKITDRQGMRLNVTQTLPVIFHIVHQGDPVGSGDNISQAIIRQQILQLNKDFANLSNSPYVVAANSEIQFALAEKDEGGSTLAEPGIERINAVSAGFTSPPYTVGFNNPMDNYLNDVIKPATIWDPAEYINIWVLPLESNILGIATFPEGSGLADLNSVTEGNTTAGIAVLPSSIGSLFSPNGGCGNVTGKGRTLTHEMGHYFGLRHIWGDANCGNDFCDDTPVHQGPNFGVPIHPKPNGCGTADEMFENYMDYCDDEAFSTFTADQVVRMQAVLTNSPRRSSLITSPAGLVTITGGNAIAFTICNGELIFSEAGIAGAYPRYRDLSLNLNVEDKASGPATVTINAVGNAVTNIDYEVLTPTVVFSNGDAFKPVNIRILDDALFEGLKQLTISYSISGSGVAAGASAQSVIVNISDDDNLTLSSGSVTLLSQDFEGALPGWNSLSSGGMPNLFRVSGNGDAGGSGLCAHISSSPTPPFLNIYDENVPGVAVLRTPLINANGVSDINVTFKYRVWGESDPFNEFDYGRLTFATEVNPTTFVDINVSGSGPYVGLASVSSGTPSVNLPNSLFANSIFHLGFFWQNDGTVGNDPPLNVDDIVVTGTGTGIETSVSSSNAFDVKAGAGVNNFRSSNSLAIASVTGLTEDVDGLVASVIQSGVGPTPIMTSSGNPNRSQKVISMVPIVSNTTAGYRATFYFTGAELAGLGPINNLRLLKVDDGVDLSVTTINSSNGQLGANLTLDDQISANGYAAFSADFTGGFSQFMLVTSDFVLPVELLSFDAKAVNKSIQLSWSTSQELNNKGFGVERSIDGNTFENIGWVDGNLTTNSRSDYRFTDHFVQPGRIYYYRLRQTDIDNREKLSVTRQARIEESGILLTVTPNPARGLVKVFMSGAQQPADINLVNLQGQLLRQWKGVNASSAPYALDISGIATGAYLLQVQLPDRKLVEKIMIR